MELKTKDSAYSFNEYNITQITLTRLIPPVDGHLYLISIQIHELKINSLYEFVLANIGKEIELFICDQGIIARRFAEPGSHDGQVNFVQRNGELMFTTLDVPDIGQTINKLVSSSCD